MDIVKKLENIRKSKKISRREVADKLHVSSSLISEIESGRSRLSVDFYVELCEFYGINPATLLNNDFENYVILSSEDAKIIEDALKLLEKIKQQIS